MTQQLKVDAKDVVRHPSEQKAADEQARLAAVRRYMILDTPPDGTFDRIASLAARIFRVPIAIVSIVDTDRIWFKAHHGIDVEETTRAPGLCASAILQYEPWIVEDAKLDPRTLANPLVAGDLGLQFYAGMPLTTRNGHNIGTICVIDKEPREVTLGEQEILRDLAAVVVDQLERHFTSMKTVGKQKKRRHAAEREVGRVKQLAQTLQRSLLPPELPKIPGLDVASVCLPSSSDDVGGDFYDVFPVSSRSWGLVIGDVCGKGPDAAALTSMVRYTLRAAATETISPADVLGKVNKIMELRESSQDGRFCTLAFARVKTTNAGAKFRVASGGHPIPFVLKANGRIGRLGGNGCMVGGFEEAEYSDQGKTLLPGDAIVFYTDGVTEARWDGEFFGEARLKRTLAECVGESAAEIVDRIVTAVRSFAPEASDDIALLVVKVQSP